MVVPTGPDTTTVVYDYYLEKDKMEELGGDLESYVEESLAESDRVQQEVTELNLYNTFLSAIPWSENNITV